jgi:hypothetical protein
MKNSKTRRSLASSFALALALALVAAAGCSRNYIEETVNTKPSGVGDDPGGATVPSGTVRGHGTPGAHMPVTGTESLQGAGGGGVGQAAKDRARAVQPGSSMDHLNESQ